LGKLFCEQALQLVAEVVGRGDEPTKNDRVKSFRKPILDQVGERFQFGVVRGPGEGFKPLRKVAELLLLRVGPVARLDELGGSRVGKGQVVGVCDRIVLRVGGTSGALVFVAGLGTQLVQPRGQHRHAGSRARHHAAQEGEGRPIVGPRAARTGLRIG
jgi:hypothetical protein